MILGFPWPAWALLGITIIPAILLETIFFIRMKRRFGRDEG